mmetsp:Transcript_3103/g.4196  ORF Transcript_3103/g.4196 Transcript_3103/m.4196 type:complete len:254 (+) Transcript_3103:339-1100(+)
MIFLPVNHKKDFIDRPDHLIDMPIIYINGYGRANLCSNTMIKCFCVHCSMNSSYIITYMLHDIDLARLWPSSIHPISWKHPYCWPSSSSGAMEKACPYKYSTISPVSQIFCDKASRGIISILVIFFHRTNVQHTIRNVCIFRSVRIVLEFIIAPTPSSNIIVPQGRIRKSFRIKLIGPYKFGWIRLRNNNRITTIRITRWSTYIRKFARYTNTGVIFRQITTLLCCHEPVHTGRAAISATSIICNGAKYRLST